MKRCNAAARIVGMSAAFWAAMGMALSGTAAWAQTMHRATAAEIAQTETAKKEVQAYKAAYAKMVKEKGVASAMRFFLTPGYKEVTVSRKTRTRDEHIQIWTDFFARLNKETKQSPEDYQSEPRVSGPLFRETYGLLNNTIVVTESVEVPALAPTAAASSPFSVALPSVYNRQAGLLQMNRKTYRRTPNGLRLQEEAVVSVSKYPYDHSEYADRVARLR